MIRTFQTLGAAALIAVAACQSDDAPPSSGDTATAGSAAPPASLASPRDTARAVVGSASVLVDYGRPSRRGRQIFGALVPYDAVWRTGANAATTLVVSAPIELGGRPLDAGTYTLYSLPTAAGWTLIVSGQTGQWGTEYNEDRDLFRVPLELSRPAAPVDTFTITVEAGEQEGAIVFAWDTVQGRVRVRER